MVAARAGGATGRVGCRAADDLPCLVPQPGGVMSAIRQGKCNLRLGVLLALVVAGCSADANRPPSLRYGEEACDHCRMLINDEHFAAAVVTEDGAIRKFDEIGCLLAYQAEHPGPMKRCWVCDYRSARWLDTREAFFVCSRQLQTPMGCGAAAVGTLAEAHALADEVHGRIVRFDELPSAIESPMLKTLSESGPSK